MVMFIHKYGGTAWYAMHFLFKWRERWLFLHFTLIDQP